MTPTRPSPNGQLTRPLRADARRNYDLLVAAADAEFTEHGAASSLEDIARRAGVGIGTLYRHFPTREDLIAKVLDQSTAAIVARGRQLLEGAQPSEQLARWLRELVVYVTTYRGLTSALANSYVAGSGTQLCEGCATLREVGKALVVRAQEAGEIRTDIDADEVILSAHAAAWISEQTQDPGAVERLLGVMLDGLRASAARPAGKPRGAARVRGHRAAGSRRSLRSRSTVSRSS